MECRMVAGGIEESEMHHFTTMFRHTIERIIPFTCLATFIIDIAIHAWPASLAKALHA